MNNNKLDDVSRMNKGESIEQKTYRFMKIISGGSPGGAMPQDHLLETKQSSVMFQKNCKLVELALAEEREANKSAYQALREMFNDGEELECDDGWRVGVDIDLWSLGIEAFDGLEAPTPKAEVGQ